ncbi:MAG TPA: hypothetical protein ACFYEA_02580 [Candidatus Tripitaka californicus]|uniref:hypothetical protein n=1 Tax=Candidatus Tripitaka californicus TaxID=3367616 RepID=UPI004025A71D|nr:hypothetical protein [Planctomycetota bacterium]
MSTAYKRLFIWVEGPDDVRFFDGIVKPVFERKYGLVKVIEYSKLKRERIDNFLKSIKAMDADYIYVKDINDAPCVTAKKEGIQKKLNNINNDRIMVVIKEIEGWYLAGLDKANSKKLRLTPPSTTDNLTKEAFNGLIPKKFYSRIDFMLEVLKCFSTEMAKQKNRSFRYFLEKHDC